MDFFGFIPNKESNTWGITILPTFLFSSGSNFRMCTASFAKEEEKVQPFAKEAIHIRKLDPELNRNVGKMVIPHVFDSLLDIKPKNPHVASLLSQEVETQDIGINLTQFYSCVNRRVNHCSNRAQRARNFISN